MPNPNAYFEKNLDIKFNIISVSIFGTLRDYRIIILAQSSKQMSVLTRQRGTF